jgi:hypothetical protein
MKLNFWQWLGIAVVVLGGIGLYIYKTHTADQSATQPAVQHP